MFPLAAVSPDQIRRATDEVLGRAEFRQAAPMDWGLDTLRRALAAIAEWAVRHPVGAWVLIVVLVLVLIALLVHLGYTFYRAVVPTAAARARQRGPGRASWEILEGAAADWPSALARAGEALDRGDPRRAVWIGHRVLLGLLDEREAIEFAAWKTNADYIAESRSSSPLLQRMTSVYDEVVYGHRGVDVGVVRGLLEQVDRTRTGRDA